MMKYDDCDVSLFRTSVGRRLKLKIKTDKPTFFFVRKILRKSDDRTMLDFKNKKKDIRG